MKIFYICLLFIVICLAIQESESKKVRGRPAVGKKSFKGCFAKKNYKPDKVVSSKQMSITKCERLATKHCFPFYAVFQKKCMMGNKHFAHRITKKQNSRPGKCKCPCPGKPKQKCGCKNRKNKTLKLFKRKLIRHSRFGCYKNGLKLFKWKKAGMNKAMCVKFCNGKRTKFATTRGPLCGCGNKKNNLGKKLKREQCKKGRKGFTIFKLYNRKPNNPKCNMKKAKVCYCRGDPHCKSFDQKRVTTHPQGRCKYDVVTTKCFKKQKNNLPKFSVRATFNNFGRKYVSMVENLILNIGHKRYVLKRKSLNFIWVNGQKRCSKTFKDKNVKSKRNRHRVKLSVRGRNGKAFMYIFFKKGMFEIKLCNKYRKKVCGLCGNYDGKPGNDIVDRKGKKVVSSATHNWVKYYKWAFEWKTPKNGQPDRKDQNGYSCKSDNNTDPEEPPKCKNMKKYRKKKNCGLLKNKGVFGDCYTQEEMNENFDDCLEDMCGDPNLKCETYRDLVDACADKGKPIDDAKWLPVVNCPVVDCVMNEEYLNQKPCKEMTCNATQSCEGQVKVRDCYCKQGFYRSTFTDKCVPQDQCDCQQMIDGSDTIISNGAYVSNADCSIVYLCNGTVTEIPQEAPCDEDATCTLDQSNGERTCTCPSDQIGDGIDCSHNNNSCSTGLCWGLGDPHYSGNKNPAGNRQSFNPTNNCTYLFASTRRCGSAIGYDIFVSQQQKGNHYFMDTVSIEYDTTKSSEDSYKIFKNDLGVLVVKDHDGLIIDLTTPFEKVVYNEQYEIYETNIKIEEITVNNEKRILFNDYKESHKFTLEYNGELYLRGYICNCPCVSICYSNPDWIDLNTDASSSLTRTKALAVRESPQQYLTLAVDEEGMYGKGPFGSDAGYVPECFTN
jgi:hypothetical protein